METYDKNGISVIICCHNSSVRLPQTLSHIYNQQLSIAIELEVIIVNNASTDNTKQVAEFECKKYQSQAIKFKIINELMPGLIYARKKGVDTASYEYLVFCDDDNWLESKYLQKAYECIHLKDNIGAVGGFGIAVSDVEFPEWFQMYQDAYAVGKQDTYPDDPTKANYLWGAGLVTRKSLFMKAYAKHPPLLVGRQANKLSCGEDAELTMRLRIMGFDLIYNSELIYQHYISINRLTISYREQLFAEGSESSSEVLDYFRLQINLTNLNFFSRLRTIFLTLFRCIFLMTKLSNIWNPQYENLKFYFLTGLRLSPIPTEATIIRNLHLIK